MCDFGVEIISDIIEKHVTIVQMINHNHNHAKVLDKGVVIHRKGAIQAEEGQYGVIPMNMLDGSYIVKGKGNQDSLCSSSHGAGRKMSRSKAKALLNFEEFSEMMSNVVSNISNNTLDENPLAYKNPTEVMAQQENLIEVVAKVKPLINIKG
jgi:tRNA-splicing ligase RtcB